LSTQLIMKNKIFSERLRSARRMAGFSMDQLIEKQIEIDTNEGLKKVAELRGE